MGSSGAFFLATAPRYGVGSAPSFSGIGPSCEPHESSSQGETLQNCDHHMTTDPPDRSAVNPGPHGGGACMVGGELEAG